MCGMHYAGVRTCCYQSGYKQYIKINTQSRDSVMLIKEDGQSFLPSSAKQPEAPSEAEP